MSHLPLPIIAFFLMTTLFSFFLFWKAVRGVRGALAGSLAWICIQSGIADTDFYLTTNTLPPRLIVAILPPLFLIAGLFLALPGRRFLDGMDLKWCVFLQSIRIPVEVTLYLLFLYKQGPLS